MMIVRGSATTHIVKEEENMTPEIETSTELIEEKDMMIGTETAIVISEDEMNKTLMDQEEEVEDLLTGVGEGEVAGTPPCLILDTVYLFLMVPPKVSLILML